MNRRVTVLWPDGPRTVSEWEIRVAASDALYNEEQVERSADDIDIDEAIEIVNHYGYYTTARRD